MNNFDETARLLARLRLMDISRYTTLAKELDVVAQDQHKRFNANKKGWCLLGCFPLSQG